MRETLSFLFFGFSGMRRLVRVIKESGERNEEEKKGHENCLMKFLFFVLALTDDLKHNFHEALKFVLYTFCWK